MNLSLILALIIAAMLGLGGAGAAGYYKGKVDAERVAKLAMDEHLVEDREAERVATEAASRHKDELATAQNAVSAAYEKGKADAEANAKRIVADLRAGNLVLHERWTSCQTSSGLSRPATYTSESDAGTADRDESAGRIVQAAAQCDAQVKGLQNLLRLERQPQPEVGSHVGPLPD